MKLTVWNKANCDRLRKWWEVDGMIARQVADKFREIGCDVTRNAVIGKVHRMKLKQPASKVETLRNTHSQTLKHIRAQQKNGAAVPADLSSRRLENSGLDARKLMEVHVTMSTKKSSVPAPDGSKAILLKHSKDGQCKAIIGYVGGKAEDAVYCGEDCVVHRTSTGRVVPTNWCPFHKSLYMTEPRR